MGRQNHKEYSNRGKSVQNHVANIKRLFNPKILCSITSLTPNSTTIICKSPTRRFRDFLIPLTIFLRALFSYYPHAANTTVGPRIYVCQCLPLNAKPLSHLREKSCNVRHYTEDITRLPVKADDVIG